MYDDRSRHTRLEITQMLASAFGEESISMFGPKSEEGAYNKTPAVVSREECLKSIKDDIAMSWEALSDLSDIHPAWVTQALEAESPKVIGVILRWLPSRHVRYILDHLPKRVKLSLPKLVESFAIPTPIVNLIKENFERKFPLMPRGGPTGSFDDAALLKAEDLEALFRDLGIHELALAFQNVEADGLRVLLNRMSVADARALQQRIKDVKDAHAEVLKDAKFTILEVAMDQEDVERLLVEIGLSAFSKALKDDKLYSYIHMRLEPKVSYLFKRYMDQHVGANVLAELRQRLIMDRLSILSKAGRINI